MNITKKERSIKLTHDCAGDFTLPDYLPAIGKLLFAECSVSSEDPYIKDNGSSGLTAELGGEVTFRVTWQSEENGEPAAAVFRCDYDTTAPIGAVSYPLCHVTTASENVFCRVTGPRKLSLRARLASRLTVLSESNDLTSEELLANGIELSEEKISAVNTSSGTARDLYAAVPLPADGEILHAHGSVNVTSCRPISKEELKAEGGITLFCVMKRDGELLSATVTAPFEENIALSGDLADTDHLSIAATGEIDSIAIHNSDASGANAEIVYSITATAMSEVTASIVRDAYACGAPSSVETEDLRYLSSPVSLSGSITVNERCEGISSHGKVLYASGSAAIVGASTDGGKLTVTGTLSGNAVTSDGGETATVTYSVPWKYELPYPVPADEIELLGSAVPISLSARADGSLTVNAEISLSCIAVSERSAARVKSLTASKDASAAASASTISVYYPERGEDIWSIAKRFRVPVARVSSKGNLNEDGTPKRVIVI